MWLSLVLPKSFPREVASVVVRSQRPCDSLCGVNAAFPVPTQKTPWLPHQLLNPTAQPRG